SVRRYRRLSTWRWERSWDRLVGSFTFSRRRRAYTRCRGRASANFRSAVRRSICENEVADDPPASVEHALLAVGVVFRLRQSDEIAEHEVIFGADARRRAHDVAGRPPATETGRA